LPEVQMRSLLQNTARPQRGYRKSSLRRNPDLFGQYTTSGKAYRGQLPLLAKGKIFLEERK